jgi:hypothetical protein
MLGNVCEFNGISLVLVRDLTTVSTVSLNPAVPQNPREDDKENDPANLSQQTTVQFGAFYFSKKYSRREIG